MSFDVPSIKKVEIKTQQKSELSKKYVMYTRYSSMIIPIRCFTCNHVLADKWKWFEKECVTIQEAEEVNDKKKNKPPAKNMDVANRAELLDKLGLKRLCCRRHMLGHVDMMDLI